MARVLVTRPEPGASATARRLAALGHDVMTAPLFTVHAVEWTPPSEPFDALMLTSANALRHAGPLPGQWRALLCYAVGKATAQAARDYGFGHVIAGSGDAEALARQMADDGVASALHLAGREHRSPPHDRPPIVTRIVYAADAVERLDEAAAACLAAGTIDYVLLYSARAARHFRSLVTRYGWDRSRLGVGVLSQQVADAVGDGWGGILVAPAPAEDQLFAACGLLCENRASQCQSGGN